LSKFAHRLWRHGFPLPFFSPLRFLPEAERTQLDSVARPLAFSFSLPPFDCRTMPAIPLSFLPPSILYRRATYKRYGSEMVAFRRLGTDYFDFFFLMLQMIDAQEASAKRAASAVFPPSSLPFELGVFLFRKRLLLSFLFLFPSPLLCLFPAEQRRESRRRLRPAPFPLEHGRTVAKSFFPFPFPGVQLPFGRGYGLVESAVLSFPPPSPSAMNFPYGKNRL